MPFNGRNNFPRFSIFQTDFITKYLALAFNGNGRKWLLRPVANKGMAKTFTYAENLHIVLFVTYFIKE
jgi:hypothetical protein